MTTYEPVDYSVQTRLLLKAIHETEQRWGMDGITKYLANSNDARWRKDSLTPLIERTGIENLSALGCGSDWVRDHWKWLVSLCVQQYGNQLVTVHFTQGMNGFSYMRLALGDRGLQILEGDDCEIIFKKSTNPLHLPPCVLKDTRPTQRAGIPQSNSIRVVVWCRSKGKTISLGSFATEDEAVAAKQNFHRLRIFNFYFF